MNKHHEMILAYSDSGFNLLNSREDNWNILEKKLSDRLWLGPRYLLETNLRFRQIIPYVIIHRRGKVIMYKRNIKAGEARLHHRHSIGFGGHIETADICLYVDQINLHITVCRALQRELREELKYDFSFLRDRASSKTFIGILKLNNAFVNQVHLGLVFLINMDDKSIPLPTECIEDGLEKYEWIDLKELMQKKDDPELNLEDWSVATLKLLQETTHVWDTLLSN